ncbi:MAG: methylated-DNA--[protein]-cysteine S-methyltransferase [Candidatus Bathyarchaeia archaeon]|jgi:O-6-methylguanine DNA methyltransferase
MIQVYTQNVNGTWLTLACTEQQIVAASFANAEQKALSKLLNDLPFNMPFQVLLSPSPYAKDIFSFMEGILEGKELEANLNLAMDKLPKYTTRVLKTVMQIPVGYVATYGAVAKAVGGGPRAVGNVMAGNIFAPIVPCHRVVKSDFSLGGYGGGLKIKYQLLTKEKRGYLESKGVSVEGGVLQVYPAEYSLKKCLLQPF